MRTGEDQLIFLNYLEKICGIYWAIIDDKENVLEKFDDTNQLKLESLWIEIINKEAKSETPKLHSIGENIYMWIFSFKEKNYVFGPVCTNQVTLLQVHKLVHQYHLNDEKINLSQFSVHQLLNLTEFSYYEITGVKLSEKKSIKVQDLLETIQSKDKTEYDLYRFNEEKKRNPYEEELNWYNRIKEGDAEESKNRIDKSAGIGTLAKKSDYKQMEYMTVAGITLATRAAIEGGVPPLVAYETSDVLLQKISQFNNLSQLLNINIALDQIFIGLVRKYKEKKKEGATIELCKEYISKHLYIQFSIQQMADELAMNRSHMSRKFSDKTGCTIQDYIRNERLKAAANLLRYSDKSVSQISDYMHFSSPSRFSSYFKEKYGVSPLRFREENKLIDFKDDN
jgi:AraC-like DNA-binding protein